MDTQVKNTKEKRRNAEKRKEKSRFAARCRRSKESEIFSSLAQVIPVQESSVAHLDKASIMRLVIAHLRIRNIFSSLPNHGYLKSHPNDKHFLKAVGGIILVMSLEGDIIYISPNVYVFLGISEVEIIGQNVYDICHPCDHKEIKDILSGKVEGEGKMSMFLRMKCTLTPKGRNLHIKSAPYKVLHIVGSMVKMMKSETEEHEKTHHHFAAIGSPIPHPANIETPLGSYTFLSKHSLDMKYTYADERMKIFLGYTPESLIGKSVYEFHHVLDNKNIQKAYKSLFAKGQSETEQYRFLAKGGGYIWVYTQATIIFCDKGNKPESVVCVNYVVSERINEEEIYSSNQLEEVKKSQIIDYINEPETVTLKVIKKVVPSSDLTPQPVTSKVFTTRTADMNKGFITFDSGFTIMKEDPEDLTHLAPTAGDACIPLETSPFNFIVDDYSISVSENYSSPLLHAEKNTTLFVKCPDEISSSSVSPIMPKSPETSSLPSLCSLQDDSNYEDPSIKNYLSYNFADQANDEITSLKSPYITGGDDLPLLMGYDLAWFSLSNSATSPSISPSSRDVPIDENLTSLSKMLRENTTIPISQPIQDQGGGTILEVINLKEKSESSNSEIEKRKRGICNIDLLGMKKRKQQGIIKSQPSDSSSNSVLMKLLVTGKDVNTGYICINTRNKLGKKSESINK